MPSDARYHAQITDIADTRAREPATPSRRFTVATSFLLLADGHTIANWLMPVLSPDAESDVITF